MVLFPNAKVNLGLNVIARRPDGFHNIETVFLPVSLCDVLEFVESAEGQTHLTITGSNLDIPSNENLVVRAWRLMNENYKVPPVDIHLHKLIPTGAGLGGGSSDAAFMLKGLNEFFQCGANVKELERFASVLGSDCAFFIRNTQAYAEGKGEILEPVNIELKNYKILLINPAIHISTSEAYKGVVPQIPSKSLKQMIGLEKSEWQKNITNDFETSVFLKYPDIAAIKEKLITSGAVYAAMSGSGSTVYGIFHDNMDIHSILLHYSQYFCWFGEFIEN
jgi:4-diphosphocytidyl-2-C-methyl-D-erythritol kinase